jgi:TonB-dependent receptor
MNQSIFRKTKLASSISMLIGAVAAAPALAEEIGKSATSNMEEVVVTGIRGSLKRSMDQKREAQGVLDAISAEDIGRMPDTNLAESLQRITGVSIDRVNGEGSRVTVRGFGPDFNIVTLNGRQMPAANIENTIASTSRSFDFANLAAEGVSGVEIYKSGRASVTTGGIGSVINIKTAKPFDNLAGISNFSVKAITDESNDAGSDWTPELSGIFSRTFADNTVGVSLSASYSERDSGYNKSATGNGWYTIPGGQGDWGSVAPDSTAFSNAPQSGQIYSVPRNVGFEFSQIQRERTNAQLTFQWAATDNVIATLDYTYSELDTEQQVSDMGSWFNGNPQSGEFTQGGTVVAPVVYSDSTGTDITFGAGDWGRINENKSLGLNVEWAVSENLVLTFDYHDSVAENGGKDNRGSNNIISSAQYTRNGTSVDYSGDIAVVSYSHSVGNGIDSSLVLSGGNSFRNSFMKHDIDQAQVHGRYTFDDSVVSSIDFGISRLESENRSAFSNAQRDTWGGYGTAADFDDNLYVRKDLSSQFDQLSGASNPLLEPSYFEVDFAGLRNAIAAVATANGDDLGSCGVILCANPAFSTDRNAVEEQTAVYAQVNFAWEDVDMPMHLAVGLRYEDTDVASTAVVPIYSAIAWSGDNEFSPQFSELGASSLDGDYGMVLPNIDFDISVTEDVVLRASLSKTLSRPNYEDIQGGQTINSPVRFNGGTGSRGNPDLDPFESFNIDLSAEWYYGDSSYFSIGYYNKDVENFIGQDTVSETTFELAHPAQGVRYQDAVAFLGSSDPGVVRPYMESLYGAPVVGDAALGDPSTVFSLITPVNVESASIDGFEISLQHVFGETGFGVVMNATTVDGDIGYDNTNTNKGDGVVNQFALLGLSDSANFVAFYDKDGIQARIAYNWRDDFLTATIDGNGERNPVYTEAYGQWDINVSYDVNDALSIYAEGINITDETQRLFGRHERMLIGAVQTGARYALGVRYSFN